MDFKYRWKNGYQPTRDEAARQQYLLDENQFKNPEDRHLAEEQARKHLNVPTHIPDDERSILPHAATPSQIQDMSEGEDINIA
jgi:hypothetical protein